MLRKKVSPRFEKSLSRQFEKKINELQDTHLKLSSLERSLLKLYIRHRLYQRLRRLYAKQYDIHFNLLEQQHKKETIMNESYLIQHLIHDLVKTGEYTIEGIATYTKIPSDVIVDIAAGLNINPSLNLAERIIDLHISTKRSHYHFLIKKLLQCLEKRNQKRI